MSSRYVLAFAIVLLVGAAVAVLDLWHRRAVWRRFAAAHGLRYAAKPAPHVAGTIDRREVDLAPVDRRTHTAGLGAQPVRLSVRLDASASAPADLRALETGAAVRAVHELVDDAVIETGDPEFDSRFTVRARSRDAALEYLDEWRRRALLVLAQENRSGFVSLRGASLSIDVRMLVSSLERLDHALERLLGCARSLDTARSQPRSMLRAAGGRSRR